MLCGTKKDLVDDRIVLYEEALNYANQKDLMYFETSAKKDMNIKEIFDNIANGIILEDKKKEIEGINSNNNNCNKITCSKNNDLKLNKKFC